ncbi:hypothetical protein L6452_30735 [Arctium lappa]|uniref:Uncharacterized protein n=1 Tax=Arctium lappa TaxID=4217 RepID=A0ACB8ZIZ5_ARCLA|nr:hypothetical protein L6452_30735 [Arctium lappa]
MQPAKPIEKKKDLEDEGEEVEPLKLNRKWRSHTDSTPDQEGMNDKKITRSRLSGNKRKDAENRKSVECGGKKKATTVQARVKREKGNNSSYPRRMWREKNPTKRRCTNTVSPGSQTTFGLIDAQIIEQFGGAQEKGGQPSYNVKEADFPIVTYVEEEVEPITTIPAMPDIPVPSFNLGKSQPLDSPNASGKCKAHIIVVDEQCKPV